MLRNCCYLLHQSAEEGFGALRWFPERGSEIDVTHSNCENPCRKYYCHEGVHEQLRDRIDRDRLHRGRSILLALLHARIGSRRLSHWPHRCAIPFYSGSNPPHNGLAIRYTFRISFAFVAIVLFLLMYFQNFKLTNAGICIVVIASQSGPLLLSNRVCSVCNNLRACPHALFAIYVHVRNKNTESNYL
jgi:hypothetical protein